MPHIHRRQSLGAESLGMIVLWIMLICAQAALAQTGARVEGKEIRIDFNREGHRAIEATRQSFAAMEASSYVPGQGVKT